MINKVNNKLITPTIKIFTINNYQKSCFNIHSFVIVSHLSTNLVNYNKHVILVLIINEHFMLFFSKMMFKAVIFATVLALAASQQAVQQYTPNNNVKTEIL